MSRSQSFRINSGICTSCFVWRCPLSSSLWTQESHCFSGRFWWFRFWSRPPWLWVKSKAFMDGSYGSFRTLEDLQMRTNRYYAPNCPKRPQTLPLLFWMWIFSETLETQWLRLKCLTRAGLIFTMFESIPTLLRTPKTYLSRPKKTRCQSLWLFFSADQD